MREKSARDSNVSGLGDESLLGRRMSKRSSPSPRYANRTPWQDAIREVSAAWLEDEAKRSSSPYSLLASWKGERGGVPSHVMIKLLRRRLGAEHPELMKGTPPPARLQRAREMLTEIWARTEGANQQHAVWRFVEELLRLASTHAEAHRAKADGQDPR